jgi:transposase
VKKSPYPKEFRDEVVEIARKSEMSIAQIAEDFGISQQTVYDWIKKADIEDGNPTSVNTGVFDAELRAAKNRIRTLEQENEVLRRATAYFSQAVLPK